MIRLNPTGYRYEPPTDIDPEADHQRRVALTRVGLIKPFRSSGGWDRMWPDGQHYVTKRRWEDGNLPLEGNYGIQLFRLWQRIVRDVIHQSYPARVWRLLRTRLPIEAVNLIQYAPPVRLLIGPPI